FEQVTRVVGQATAMREHVGHGYVLADPRVGESEAGALRLDGRIPVGVAYLLGQRRRDHRRTQRLRHRGQLEDRVRGYLADLADLAYADSVDVADDAVIDHRDGEPGNSRGRHVAVDDLFQGSQPARHPGGRDVPVRRR